MRIAQKTHYGIQALVYLADHRDEWVSLRTLADSLNISLAFLKHIAVALKRNRILRSQGGLRGGYQLARSPAEISLMAIFRSLGEPIRLEPCKTKQCNHQKCVTGVFWEGVSRNLQAAFEQTTLDVVLRTRQPVA